MLMKSTVAGISAGVVILATGAISAQEYPNKPIRIVSGGAPGGGSDIVARLFAQGISGPLGQPVIVDNRAEAIAGPLVAKALPDGYTLLFVGTAFYIGPLLREMPYDTIKDFAP